MSDQGDQHLLGAEGNKALDELLAKLPGGGAQQAAGYADMQVWKLGKRMGLKCDN